jgi:tryptophan synthase alpha chain
MLYLPPSSPTAPPAGRLDRSFAEAKAEGRAALATYLPVGYPSMPESLDALLGMAQSADILELGVPHTDPVFDGPVIRQAAARSLASGFHMRDLFAAARELTASSAASLLVMSYWRPIEEYGAARFADELAAAGVAAVIVPDLAVADAGRWSAAVRAAGLHTVNLVAPDADADELARVCAASSGMVYAPATIGTTGSQGPLGAHLPRLLDRLRALTSVPIGVGIGVSTVEQAAHVSALADAVVIGSPLIRRMQAAPHAPAAAAAALAREFAEAVRRPAGPAA